MKLAIYARVSTEQQEKQETINSQLEALREYARVNNHEVHQEYTDEGYSGELLDRPALDHLRDDARKHLFEAVLVHSPDRLSRKYIYAGILQEELLKSGIPIIFLNRPDSKDTPEENLLAGVQGLIAEYEKAKILERTRRGRMHKARSGILVGGLAPYGYHYVKGEKVGRYEIVPEEASTVRLIFDLFLNKEMPIRAIARELTRRGIRPRQGIHWRASSLHKIIRNETYAGTTHYNKHISVEAASHKNGAKYRRIKNTSRRLRTRDLWIPISLSDDLRIIAVKNFGRAQLQLVKNAQLSPRNVKYQYLLRGLVHCGSCDAPFYGAFCKGNMYYRCGNRSRTFPLPRTCMVPMVKGPDLEEAVWSKFSQAIRDPDLIIQQLPKLKTRVINDQSIARDHAAIDKELAIIDTEESRLLDAYRQNVITMDQLKNQMAKIRGRKADLLQEKDHLNRQQSVVPAAAEKGIRDYCAQIARRLDKIENDFEAKRYLLSLALTKVCIKDKAVRIRGVIPGPSASGSPDGCIASTLSANCGHRQPPLPALF